MVSGSGGGVYTEVEIVRGVVSGGGGGIQTEEEEDISHGVDDECVSAGGGGGV